MDEQRLKIIVTTNTLKAGGAERQRVLLVNELALRGHTMTLWCMQGYGPLRATVNPKVTVVGPSLMPPIAEEYDYVISGTTNTESAGALMLKTVRGQKTQWVVAIHNPLGPGAPRLKRLSRAALQLCDLVLALTPSHAAAIERDWGVVVDDYVPNRINLSWSQDARARRELSKPMFDVGFLGRISIEHKGLDLLVKALASRPACSLTLAIAGEGSDEPRLRRLIADEGIQGRVIWLGHQDPQDFLPNIRTLALFSRYEGQPLTLLEAEAAGVPVVASTWAGADAESPSVMIVDPYDSDTAGTALMDQSNKSIKDVNKRSHLEGVPEMADDYLRCLADARRGASKRFRRRASNRSSWIG